MKLKDNSPKEIDTALYQLEQKLNNKINNIEFPEQKVYDDKDIRAALETEISDRKAALKQEADDRKTNDNKLQTSVDAKQNKLIAGDNITITDDKISATDTTYTATSPIKLSGTDIQLDVVPVDKGGTGKTTAKNAFMNLAEGLDEGSGPLDTESVIYRNADGSNWGRYTLATVWGWIKSKIENVFSSLISHPSDTNNPHSVTKAQVGLGNCDNTADKDKNVNSAQYVIDSANTSKIIEIAYANTGLTSSTATHFAAFGAPEHSGTEKTIRDLSVAEAKKLLGVDNVNNTADSDKSVNYATSAGSATTATKLATARNISITDGTNTGTASTFDGSDNISLRLPSVIQATSFLQNGSQVLTVDGYKGHIYIIGSKVTTNPYLKLAAISFQTGGNMDYFTKFRFSMLGCGVYSWCDFTVTARISQGEIISNAPSISFLNASGNTAINYFYESLYVTYTLSNKILTMTLWVNGNSLQYASYYCYYLQEFESAFADFCMYMQSYGNLWTKTQKIISNATGDASSLPSTVGDKCYAMTFLDNISCKQLVIPTTSSTTNGAIWIG